MEDAMQTFSALQNNLNKFIFNQADAGLITAYKNLGVNPSDNPEKILETLRKRMQHAQASGNAGLISQTVMFMKQMGIADGMINTLALSNKDFAKSFDESFMMTDKQVKKLRELGQEMGKLKGEIYGVANSFMAALSPELGKLGDKLFVILDALNKVNNAFANLGKTGGLLAIGDNFKNLMPGFAWGSGVSHYIVDKVIDANQKLDSVSNRVPSGGTNIYQEIEMTPQELAAYNSALLSMKDVGNAAFHVNKGEVPVFTGK
jgi:hypothetical protein